MKFTLDQTFYSGIDHINPRVNMAREVSVRGDVVNIEEHEY